MPTAKEILSELKPLGKERYKQMLMTNHGVKEPCYGVSVSELKKIQKRIKKDYQLALDLFDSGNYDAQYLAGLIADDARMSERDLQRWVDRAGGGAIPGSTVPWVAAGSPHGWKMAMKWIDSPREHEAGVGWGTLASHVSIHDDSKLDLKQLQQLLKRVQKEIHRAPNTVRYQMNAFVIAVAAYVAPLTEQAMEAAEKIGQVKVDMGNNSCEVPFAPDYIRKIQKRGAVGKKRKSAKC